MKAKLADLEYDTIFHYDGLVWQKTRIVKDKKIKCNPYLGGQFQSNLGQLLPEDLDVSVLSSEPLAGVQS